MSLNIQQWHRRYQQQARWTENLRKYVYERIKIDNSKRILDVGCGTGVLMNELQQMKINTIIGLDINEIPLHYTKSYIDIVNLINGDALDLPFSNKSFDVSLCHFLLLWVKNPYQVLQEMVRVTRQGGFVLALAEPDYGGRIDYPDDLSQIGYWQTEALQKQGANTTIGRELRYIFSRSNLLNVEVGVLGGQWRYEDSIDDVNLEWEVIEADLENNENLLDASLDLKKLGQIYRENNVKILYVPTFYAIGEVAY